MADWGAALLPRFMALAGDRRLPVLIGVLLILLLAQGLATLTWTLLPRPQPESVRVSPATMVHPTRQVVSVREQGQQIARWHLFGELQKAVPKSQAMVIDAPDTRLNLKLSGLLASSDPERARAIIADGKSIEDAYAVDDPLPDNAVLREIYADRVILEYRGRLETLRLPKDSDADALAPPSARSTRSSRSSPQLATPAGNAETAALLRQYREALVNNPQSLMNLVSASPVNDPATGRLKGYAVRPGKDRKLLGRFGLKAGDVVMAVNGVTLDNPIKALEVMRDLSTSSSVSLDIERNGVRESLSFQVD
jgi:general secretion pathway protein C